MVLETGGGSAQARAPGAPRAGDSWASSCLSCSSGFFLTCGHINGVIASEVTWLLPPVSLIKTLVIGFRAFSDNPGLSHPRILNYICQVVFQI